MTKVQHHVMAISKCFIDHLPKASAQDCVRFLTAIHALKINNEHMYFKVTCHFLGVTASLPSSGEE